MAVRMRSRLSLTALSGRPTTMNAGRPLETLVSISTLSASMPTSEAAKRLVSMGTMIGGYHCETLYHHDTEKNGVSLAGRSNRLTSAAGST